MSALTCVCSAGVNEDGLPVTSPHAGHLVTKAAGAALRSASHDACRSEISESGCVWAAGVKTDGFPPISPHVYEGFVAAFAHAYTSEAGRVVGIVTVTAALPL